MAEYIDAEEVKRAVVEAVDSGMASQSEDLVAIIDDLPAADVEPVRRRGRWKIEPTKPGHKNRKIKRCSCCGWQNACRYDYCPNCGAKMDEGETDENQGH